MEFQRRAKIGSDVVRRLVKITRAGGLSDEKLYMDPLVMAISTGTENGNIALETCRNIKTNSLKSILHADYPIFLWHAATGDIEPGVYGTDITGRDG